MRNTLFFALLVYLTVMLSAAWAQESLTITSYYPSPAGVYKTLTFHAHTGETPSPNCGAKGKMYYDDGSTGIKEGLYLCNGTHWNRLATTTGEASAWNGGWFQNGEYFGFTMTCEHGPAAGGIGHNPVAVCCEQGNPLNGGQCGCPADYESRCYEATDEAWFPAWNETYGPAAAAGKNRARYDENCFCVPTS